MAREGAALEHDPEKACPGHPDPRGNRCSEKIILKQKVISDPDEIESAAPVALKQDELSLNRLLVPLAAPEEDVKQ
jgi:hypothetical protein